MQRTIKLVFLVLVALFLVIPTVHAQAIRAKDTNGRLVDVLADTLGRLIVSGGGGGTVILRDAVNAAIEAYVGPLAGTLTATTNSLSTISNTYFYESGTAAFMRWLGDDMNNAIYLNPATRYSPFVQSFLYGWDTTNNDRWHRLNVDATGALIVAGTSSGDAAIKDGVTATILATVFQDHADGLANTNNGLNTAAFGYGYNTVAGTWGRLSTHAYGDALAATQMGIDVTSYTLYYDSAGNAKRWTGTTLADDKATPASPWVGSFGMWYDTVGTNWDMASAHAAGDSLSATMKALDTLSYNLFYDGTNYRRWLGSVLSSETVANTSYAPHTKSLLSGYDAASSSWRWVNVIDTQADNLALSLNGMFTTSVMMAYDGATLDMLRTGSVGELQVTDVATRAGEDVANDWRKIKKQETAVLAPIKTTTASIGAVATVVLASTELLSWPNYCIWIKNNDGADPFTDVDYQVSPDGTSWVDLTEPASCDTLAARTLCVFCEGPHAYRYVKIQVTGAAGPTISSVDCWITGSKG